MNEIKHETPPQAASQKARATSAGEQTPPGLDGDFQSLVEAVTRLAEVSARPVIRTLRTVERSVSGEASPRVRLQGLQNAGAELVATSLKLVEKMANLALDAVAGGKATQAGTGAEIPGAELGATLRLPMAVENPTSTAMVDLGFAVARLEGPPGSTLTRNVAKIVPERQTIQPGDFEKVVLLVGVPADAHPGVYSGELAIEGHDVTVPFQFAVTAK